MDEQPVTKMRVKKKHSIDWSALILWPFLILLLYVLSCGPVYMMQDKGRIRWDNEFVWYFYKPLKWSYDNTPLHKPLGMYFRLWVPRGFDKNGDEKGGAQLRIEANPVFNLALSRGDWGISPIE